MSGVCLNFEKENNRKLLLIAHGINYQKRSGFQGKKRSKYEKLEDIIKNKSLSGCM